jgi:leukotriene-A4 hydrolase
LTGKDIFNKIFRTYIETFKYKSIESSDWKDFFINKFSELQTDSTERSKVLNQIDWDTWINKPGYPPIKNNFSNFLIFLIIYKSEYILY